MKVLIWIHRDDIITGKITQYHFQCPQPGYKNYVQVEITQDEFAQLEDKNKDYTYPEFVEKHYDEIPDIVKEHQTITGGEFQEWWAKLTKEQQITITKYYDR